MKIYGKIALKNQIQRSNELKITEKDFPGGRYLFFENNFCTFLK